jgi:predicted nucleic acid-binding protein
MKVGLDTSVVLRLIVGQPEDQTRLAIAFLDEIRRGGHQAVVDDLVVAEAYFAAQYHYGITKAAVLAALDRMFQAGEIVATGRADRILSMPGLASAKPGFVDRLIHASYTGSGETMATFEKSAGKLERVRVLK